MILMQLLRGAGVRAGPVGGPASKEDKAGEGIGSSQALPRLRAMSTRCNIKLLSNEGGGDRGRWGGCRTRPRLCL